MSSKRRKYTPEFKADAVQLVVVAQRPIAQVARELEINESSLGYWVKIYREQHPDPVKAPPPVEAARLAALEAEVRRLSEENAFLKKAAAFFAWSLDVAFGPGRLVLNVPASICWPHRHTNDW